MGVFQDNFFKTIRFVIFWQRMLGLSRVSIKLNTIIYRSELQNLLLFLWATVATCYFSLLLNFKLREETTGQWFAHYAFLVVTYYIQILHIISTTENAVVLYRSCQSIQFIRNVFPKYIIKHKFRDITTYIMIGVIFYNIYKFSMFTLSIFNNKGVKVLRKYYIYMLCDFISDIDILLWAKICNYLKNALQRINEYFLQHILNKNDMRERINCTTKFEKRYFILAFERIIFCFSLTFEIYKYTVSIFEYK